MRQDYVRPVTLDVAPVTATTPGHPGQLALWPGGFHLRAYPGAAAFPPPNIRLSMIARLKASPREGAIPLR